MPENFIKEAKIVLIVEDDDLVRIFLTDLLESAGYGVIVAENGEKALTKFKEHNNIALILTDVVMPNKNGKEFFNEIITIRPGTKVIFMSGFPGDIFSNECLGDVRINFLSKPFTAEALFRKIREVMERN